MRIHAPETNTNHTRIIHAGICARIITCHSLIKILQLYKQSILSILQLRNLLTTCDQSGRMFETAARFRCCTCICASQVTKRVVCGVKYRCALDVRWNLCLQYRHTDLLSIDHTLKTKRAKLF